METTVFSKPETKVLLLLKSNNTWESAGHPDASMPNKTNDAPESFNHLDWFESGGYDDEWLNQTGKGFEIL